MLLSLLLLGSLMTAQAEKSSDLPSFEAKTFHLDAYYRVIKGRRKESRAGRQKFCGEQITPQLLKRGDQNFLSLNSYFGFEWRSINNPTPDVVKGCRYPLIQKVTRHSLEVISREECDGGRAVANPERETLSIKPRQIVLETQVVKQDSSGGWTTDKSKEGFACVWSAD